MAVSKKFTHKLYREKLYQRQKVRRDATIQVEDAEDDLLWYMWPDMECSYGWTKFYQEPTDLFLREIGMI